MKLFQIIIYFDISLVLVMNISEIKLLDVKTTINTKICIQHMFVYMF